MITIAESYIVPPTKFTLTLSAVSGFDPNNDYVELIFSTDKDTDTYIVKNDPENDEHSNCEVVEGNLRIIFENYPFTEGRLLCREHYRQTSTVFPSGYADQYSKVNKLNVYFIK